MKWTCAHAWAIRPRSIDRDSRRRLARILDLERCAAHGYSVSLFVEAGHNAVAAEIIIEREINAAYYTRTVMTNSIARNRMSHCDVFLVSHLLVLYLLGLRKQ
jgi:hypothetical protein